MLTRQQYNDLVARSQRYDAWSQQFKRKNGWTVISADAKPPDDAQIDNAERSAIEVYEFITDPPKRYFLYINRSQRIATTWMGDKLGSVAFGREFVSNFGDKRIPISIRAINGKSYAGIYFSSTGDYARIKMLKESEGDEPCNI